MRDTLITVAALTLSNRSKELSTMKLCEAEKYVEKLIDGEKYLIINVHDHKRSKSGKPVPVALTQTSHKVLMKYVTFVRTRIAPEGSPYMFATSTAHPTNPTGILSYPAINKILAKAENNIIDKQDLGFPGVPGSQIQEKIK